MIGKMGEEVKQESGKYLSELGIVDLLFGFWGGRRRVTERRLDACVFLGFGEGIDGEVVGMVMKVAL